MNTPKIRQILPLGLALICLAPTALAQKDGGERESRMLMHLLKMDDAELKKLGQTVERIEAMSPEERANMRQRLGKLQQMDPERRQALRERFDAIPPEKRQAMRQRWMEMSPEDRREWRRKLRDMNPEERADAMEEAGFMPPKPRHKKHGKDAPEQKGKGDLPEDWTPKHDHPGPPAKPQE